MIQLDVHQFRDKVLKQIDDAARDRNQGQIDALIKEAEENSQLDIANYAWGRSAYLTSELQRAVDFLDAALRLNPLFPGAYNWKSIALLDAGKYDAAIDCINQAIENLVLLNYAMFYYNKGIIYKR